MTSRTEIISRLISQSALLAGERNLTRITDKATLAATKTLAVSTPVLMGDRKAVAGVLMALLDDRLDASDADMTNAARTVQTQIAPSLGDREPSRRAAQHYADNAFSVGENGVRNDMIALGDSARIPGVVPVISGDLESFIQRSAVLAAGRSDGLGGAVMLRSRRDEVLAYLAGLSAQRLAGVIAGTLLLILLIAKFALG